MRTVPNSREILNIIKDEKETEYIQEDDINKEIQ
jgi:hypothetical protein